MLKYTLERFDLQGAKNPIFMPSTRSIIQTYIRMSIMIVNLPISDILDFLNVFKYVLALLLIKASTYKYHIIPY